MHGIIHAELKKYVEARHGADAWTACLKTAGLASRAYMALSVYPDEEATAIVSAASKLTDTPAETILEDFGEFITPDLMSVYASLIKPEWKTMEMLLRTEETIHRIVRLKSPGAQPPQLRFEAAGQNELRLFYASPRGMAAVARGIIKGVAKHYGETVSIREQKNQDGSTDMRVSISPAVKK
jgi:hypothetical protein